jgi:hypothetical protein
MPIYLQDWRMWLQLCDASTWMSMSTVPLPTVRGGLALNVGKPTPHCSWGCWVFAILNNKQNAALP